MRAAVLTEYGVPRAGDFDEPVAREGQAVVEVSAAGLNPVDVAICGGRFYPGKPPPPRVPRRGGGGPPPRRRADFRTPPGPFRAVGPRPPVDPAFAGNP